MNIVSLNNAHIFCWLHVKQVKYYNPSEGIAWLACECWEEIVQLAAVFYIFSVFSTSPPSNLNTNPFQHHTEKDTYAISSNSSFS